MSAVYREIPAPEFEDIRSRILYEDNHLLIFNKRVGEIVQGDKTGDEALSETLKAFIAQRDEKPGQVFMGVPHRLDRPVSGVCIFAKTSKALERLNEMLRKGDIHKTYWALTANRPPKDEDTLTDNLVRNEKQNKSYIVKEGGKEARLAYKLIGTTKTYFLLEVQLFTGRHHQIRCQLSGMGCPIKGDLKYGAKRSNPDGGISLHARNIQFIHPVKKTEVDVTAPVPDTWKGIQG
ncbi:MAG: RluA family pseudouridine synthase [Bacteroidales bacterium]|nr:RluA family pseudouridine synthase [Bacteroidales bacterium]